MANNIARPVRLAGFCGSEKTNVNSWLEPDAELGDTESAEGSEASTVSMNCLVAVRLFVSVTISVNAKGPPVAAIIPLNTPALVRVSAGGNDDPFANDHVYGCFTPAATSVCE